MFDTIDHTILLDRLNDYYGISELALGWLKSYLSGRTHFVKVGSTLSHPVGLQYGVPQGSVIGPILFSLYTNPISSIVHSHSSINHHFYDKGHISFLSNETWNPFIYARNAVLEEGESFFAEVQKLNFDLVFVDSLFLLQWYYLIPHRIGVPYVSLSNILNPVASRVPWLPSFVPHQILGTSDRMTFIERMQNVFVNIMFQFTTFVPPVSPDTLAKYKEYGDGVVSFGSGIKYLPSDIAKKMSSVFSRLNENVIWRFYNTQNFVIPKNVRLSN